ncbi:MAG: L,D-transpeptidase/peptidoglycan binding protein [Cellulosilyticum sp.]|nr:L,D-transpeptidase/peptidoglycan binding protein [Cellulosilyticum sp.]
MKKILKGVLLGFIAVIHIALVVNEGFILYFMNHLCYGTHINGIDVGGWKVSKVKALLEEPGEDYELTLEERGNKEEKILGSDIEFYYETENQVKNIKKEQYPYWWLQGLWKRSEYDVEVENKYDETLLEEKINALECLVKENNVEPENAGLELVNGKYEIIEGDPGSTILKANLTSAIKEAIEMQEENLSLEEHECYKLAEVTTEDEGLKARKEALNKYVGSVITYDFGDRQEVLTGETIDQWIEIDYNNNVTLNEEAVGKYVTALAEQYDTLSGSRSFNTSVGTTVSVSGGDYGWKIDRAGETQALVELLKKGNQHITRTPVYAQEGYCRNQNDIGNSYVEINLSRQYLWFYMDGKLMTEGSIVSGTGSNSYATPAGTYKLDYKQANAVLRGPGYACPVSYWMPFNGGIGIHDATWRGSFGGSIYMYNGSHGCINTPLSMAKTIFGQIEKGMPIVCYHDAV